MPPVPSDSGKEPLQAVIDICSGIPDFDQGSDQPVSLWLSRFLEGAAHGLNLDGLMVFMSTAADVQLLTRHGFGDMDTDQLIEQIEYQREHSPGVVPPSAMSRHPGMARADTIVVARGDEFWTVMRSDLPDDRRLWCVFVRKHACEPRTDQAISILADHIYQITTTALLARKARMASQDLDRANQELKEMQISSLNIMEDLQRRNRDLEMLNVLAQEIVCRATLTELVKGAAEAAAKMLDGASVAVYLCDVTDHSLRLAHVTGGRALSDHDEFRILPTDPLYDEISKGMEIRCESVDDSTDLRIAQAIGAKTCVLMPLCLKRKVLGLVMACETRWHRIFTDDEVENLKVLAATLAVAIENANLLSQMAGQVEEISTLKEYIETVVDSVDLGVIVVDADLTIRMLNKGLERLYGYRQDDFLGKHLFEAFPHLMEQGCAEIVQQVRSGTPFERYGWRRRLADGREAVQNIKVSPHKDASGKIIGGIIIIEDITEKANLEERLARSEAKFTTVVEDLDDGYLIITDGKIAYANKAASGLTGRAAFKLLGLGIGEIISEERLVSECARPTGTKLKLESRVNHASGTWIPVEVSLSSSEYGGKRIVSVIMVDITDRKKIEKQLEQKNREMRQRNEQITRLNLELEATVNKLKASQENLIKSERVAAITETAVAANHEINNPLFSVLGQAQLLIRKYKGQDEDTLRRLHMIEESALRISCVTKKLANLADPVVKEYPGIAAHMIDVDRSTTR